MTDQDKSCLNCGADLSLGDKYCLHCGQKARHFDLSIKNIITSFIAVFFNVDNKVFQTIKDLYIPNKITQAFVKGNTKRYVHPFKTLFISLIILFFAISQLIKDLDMNQGDNYYKSQLKMEQAYQLDALAGKSWLTSDNYVDSLKMLLLGKKSNPAQDTFDFNFDINNTDYAQKYGITVKDVYSLKEGELLDKYKVEGFFDRLAVRQILRSSRDKDKTLRFFINNMLWGIVIVLFLGSFIFYLLYLRHKTYYQEHVMMLANYFTITFLPISLILIFSPKTSWLGNSIPYLLAFTSLFFVYSLKKYFKQSWFKTLLKSMLLAIALFAILIIVVIVIFLISVFIF